MQVAIVLLLVACLAQQVCDTFAARKVPSLPKDFATCKIGDDACLLRAISGAVKLLKNGNAKIGAAALEPLRVTEMHINQGTGPVNIKLAFRNLNLSGLSGLEVYSAKGEFGDKTYRLEVKGKIPSVTLYGDYSIDGRVLILPIRGSGKENLTFTDMDTTTIFTGHVITRDGHEYVQIDDAKLTLAARHLYMHFANLFDGDERLGVGMNSFLNENWSDIFNELKPAAQESLGDVIREVAFMVYDKVPYRRIHKQQ